MRKEVTLENNNNHVTIAQALYTPVPVALTEKVTFFILRGCVDMNSKLFTTATVTHQPNIVYSNDYLDIHDYRNGDVARILKIDIHEKPSEDAHCAFDFYGGDLIIIPHYPNYYYKSVYVFIPYLNLFYLINPVASDNANIPLWGILTNELRCVAAVHKLCSQLILISNDETTETTLYELQNLQKLAIAWATPMSVEEFDWEHEAKKLLDTKVVPKLKKFTINNNCRRIRLD